MGGGICKREVFTGRELVLARRRQILIRFRNENTIYILSGGERERGAGGGGVKILSVNARL